MYEIIAVAAVYWLFMSVFSGFFGMDKRLGFLGTVITSLFFSPPIGVLCAFLTGFKSDYPSIKK